VRFAALLLLFAFPSFPAERRLVDEVVAVVDAHSIMLSELTAETRIRLADTEGAQAAFLPLDRRILAASLRTTIDERVILAEVERLRLFDLDRVEIDGLLTKLKTRFTTQAEWEAFTRSIEMTDDEIGLMLARELRVSRYLDNRLKLAAQLRDSELQSAQQGKPMTTPEREALRTRLSQEKYQRLLQDLLADLKKRTTVRILDPLDDPSRRASGER
jgi:hypothetical protein